MSSPDLTRIAHRGLHDGDTVENSAGAVRRALQAGVDGIEVDLQRLGDGRFVLDHERVRYQDRIPRDLRTLNLNEYRQCVSWSVMTLEECLNLDWGTNQWLVLEVKERRSPAATVRRLTNYLTDDCSARVVISSRTPSVLDCLHRLTSGTLGAVVKTKGEWSRSRLNRERYQWHLYHGLVGRQVQPGAPREHPVWAWTVNDPEEAERLAQAGVDGIMTDNPELL